MKMQKLLALLCRKAGRGPAPRGQIRIMRGSTWHAGAREKQMKQSPNQSACRSPKGTHSSLPTSAHRVFKAESGLLPVWQGRSVSNSPLAFQTGFFWQVALETSGNTGVELVRKHLQCPPSIGSTQKLNSRGFPGFVLGGFGGSFLLFFFQTLQSCLPGKMSPVLQHKFWYTSV